MFSTNNQWLSHWLVGWVFSRKLWIQENSGRKKKLSCPFLIKLHTAESSLHLCTKKNPKYQQNDFNRNQRGGKCLVALKKTTQHTSASWTNKMSKGKEEEGNVWNQSIQTCPLTFPQQWRWFVRRRRWSVAVCLLVSWTTTFPLHRRSDHLAGETGSASAAWPTSEAGSPLMTQRVGHVTRTKDSNDAT